MTNQELEKIYNDSYRAVYWTAMSLLKNEADAEDIVQETFLSLIKSYDSIQDKSKVNAWLKKTAANKCLDRIKLTKTVNVEDEFFENVEDVPEDFLPDSLIESAEMRKVIMDIIEKSLSEEIRRTLILYYFDEMTTKEISEVLGVPQGTILWRLSFAKKKIKKEVEKYEKDNDTKLFMVVPFLSNLFMKEAEQVPFKPMPASLLSHLSASAEASTGEAVSAASEAAKKGTGIIMKKAIIGGIAAVVAIGAIIGIAIAIAHRSPAKKIVDAHGTSQNGREVIDKEDADSTALTKPAQHDEDTYGKDGNGSIYVYMDDMTSEEVVENLWRTTDVHTGMTREEYCKKLALSDDPSLLHYDKFSWSFDRDGAKRFISVLEVYSKDECDPTFKGDDDYSFVHLLVYLGDEDFSEDVFKKIIERFESEGYSVKSDVGNGVRLRTVRLQGNGRTFDIQARYLNSYFIELNIPLIGK